MCHFDQPNTDEPWYVGLLAFVMNMAIVAAACVPFGIVAWVFWRLFR